MNKNMTSPEYINKTEDDKITTLMIACRDGSEDQVEILTNKGAKINAKDRNGLNALLFFLSPFTCNLYYDYV